MQIFCALAVSMLLSGCFIRSLNPFYTDGSVIELPAAKGQWKFVERGNENLSDKYKEPWIFTEDTIETFEKGVKSTLNAKYFTIENDIFVDLSPAEPDEGKIPNEWWAIHVMPVHSVCKVDIADDTLSLTPLNGELIAKLMEKKEFALSYVSTDPDGDEFILTASSKDLMAFLKKYKNEPEAFPKDNCHVFNREKSSDKPAAVDGK